MKKYLISTTKPLTLSAFTSNYCVKRRKMTHFSLRLMYKPWGRLKIDPYFWQASPTVGVYTTGSNSST